MNTASLNNHWSKLIIDQLVQLGVDYFCISPGSRSAPLVLAVSENSQAKTMIHFDERGMAFHALGYAKASGRPAALIVTSGTAIGNLFPAIMEASASRVPLIILTADRPPELRDCGANQTADHVKIYSDYVRWQADLPCPEPALADSYLSSTLSQAVYRSMHAPKGPVHLNCMFREPLFSSDPSYLSSTIPTRYEESESIPSSLALQMWAEKLAGIEKGVIIVGSLQSSYPYDALYSVAEKLQWPIFPDIISGVREQGLQKQVIPHYDALLKILPESKVEAVLHLGERTVSKTLSEKVQPNPYFLVANNPCRHDPKHTVSHRIECDPLLFCKMLEPYLPQRTSSWHSEWKEKSEMAQELLEDFFCRDETLTEPGIIKLLPSNYALFLANSMPIRDADQLYFPKSPTGPIFSNRGISGIDGNIATAIGLAQGCQRPLLAMLGDQAFLYDINSLAQIKKAKYPVILIVINNGGGGIFSFLPIGQIKPVCEEYFAAAHEMDFHYAANLFDLPYYHPQNKQDWEEIFSESDCGSCIIEVKTDRQENHDLHKEMIDKLCLAAEQQVR